MVKLLAAVASVGATFAAGRKPAVFDWLVQQPQEKAEVRETEDGGIVMMNGLVARQFVFNPAFGTTSILLNATADFGGPQDVIRAIKPEGYVTLDNTRYAIGGLGQKGTMLAYADRSDLELTADAGAFQYVKHEISVPETPYEWVPGTRHSDPSASWPPTGTRLNVDFKAPTSALAEHQEIHLQLSFEMYDGIPLMKKWATVTCDTCKSPVQVKHIEVEVLGVNAPFGAHLTHGSFAPGSDWGGVADQSAVAPSTLIHAKTDQAHGAACNWDDDSPNSRSTRRHIDEGAVEPVLNCTYTLGPGAYVGPSETFESFRAITLIQDSFEVERQSLSRARVTELLAPATTENPIFFHATKVGEKDFKTAVDQMAEVGFEMLIYSFGSGFVLETADPTYIAKVKSQVAYAQSKGIEVGGYDLICLARGHDGYGGNVGDEWDRVDEQGELREDACFASSWVDKLKGLVFSFINETGLSMLETDGPYGGGTCSSTTHTHHHGLEDSVYRQTQQQAEFYKYLRTLNVFINQPDNFFFAGGSKAAMGYSEAQYSLPRWEDLMISRQGMYDDLYIHLPTQGWMFLPIVEYQGGGPAAMFAPLEYHLEEYEWALAQYLGAGVAACYRGGKLYDGPKSKAVLMKWTQFYKAHRPVLTKQVVHLRRPTMQDWDGFLHVHPFADSEVGLAMLFNPTSEAIDTTITLPLYYTGLKDSAMITEGFEGVPRKVELRGNSIADIDLQMKPRGITFLLITRPMSATVV